MTSYFIVKKFMTKYSKLISEIAMYSRQSKNCNYMITNFKRWSKYDIEFTKIMNNERYFKMIQVLLNIWKSKIIKQTNLTKQYVHRSIIIDYISIESCATTKNTNIKNSFILGCKLLSPPLINVFRNCVTNETIEQVLSPKLLDRAKIMGNKVDFLSEISSKKIVKNLKDHI